MADQGREGMLSPFLRQQRLKAAMPYLNGRILDVGCGAGALAEFVDPRLYCGVEIDVESLNRTRSDFPHHRFEKTLPDPVEKFDTIVALAVIEHVPDPVAFLKELSRYLVDASGARIVITTPHPSVDWIHKGGAAIGLFSKHASEEHEELLNRARMEKAGRLAGLKLVSYRRFLLGANQIAVFERGD